jgi:uncharacterized membrane protein YciS (DUF1049 family)
MAQSYDNHTRTVPGYHYVLSLMLFVNAGLSIYRAMTDFSIETAIGVLVAFGLLLVAFYARTFALKAQDRLIRLEMQLRLRGLLPPDLASRIPSFSLRQLIALRFASDAELPDLARKVLDGGLREPKEIKKSIRNWQEDSVRV